MESILSNLDSSLLHLASEWESKARGINLSNGINVCHLEDPRIKTAKPLSPDAIAYFKCAKELREVISYKSNEQNINSIGLSGHSIRCHSTA